MRVVKITNTSFIIALSIDKVIPSRVKSLPLSLLIFLVVCSAKWVFQTIEGVE